MLVRIKNLRVIARLGVHEWEKSFERELLVRIELEVDAARAVQSDRLEDTADYEAVVKSVNRLFARTFFALLERAADAVARLCLEFPRVLRVKVEIEKPGAVAGADSISVATEVEAGSA